MYTEIGKVACPDCQSVLIISMTLPTDDGRAVSFAKCARCYTMRGDKRSVRGFIRLTSDEWEDMIHSGLPVVKVAP